MKENTTITTEKQFENRYPNTIENDPKSFVNKTQENHYHNRIFYTSGIAWGILATITMTIFLKLGESLLGNTIGLMYGKYFFLGTLLFFALAGQKKYLSKDYHFSNGIKFGALISFISALSLAFLNIALSLIESNWGFDKFSKINNTAENIFLISGTLFFETLVFGIILTLICLQYLKRKN